MSSRDYLVEIPVGHDHVEGTLVVPSATVPAVLFAHGWGGSQEQYVARAREIAALGCVCLTFDFRGHVRHEQLRETITRGDNLADFVAAYDALARQRGVDESAIGVAGSSYGAYLAAILTTIRPVRWLSLRAPALYKDDNWDLPKRKLHEDPDFVAFRRREVSAQENRALSACARFEGDVLIVESEHDAIVPHPVIANYAGACSRARSLTTRVIEGADHGLSQEASQRAYTTLLVSWLTEMVSPILSLKSGSRV